MAAALAPSVSIALGRFRAALDARFGTRVREVTLFGSHARGEAHEESDVDLLVVIDDLTLAERGAVFDLAYDVDSSAPGDDGWVGLEPIVYSTAHAADMRAREGPSTQHRPRRGARVTEDNRRKNIAIEVERGDRSYRSATILQDAGEHADAVSRAYYGAYHYARALLLTLGEEPETHAGVQRLLNRDLVRAGAMSPDVARLLSKLQKLRLDADYSAEVVFTAQGAGEELASAQAFIDEARAILARGGWLA